MQASVDELSVSRARFHDEPFLYFDFELWYVSRERQKKKWKLNEPLTSANRIESPSNALPIILSGELTSKSNQSRRILTNEGTTVQRGRGKNEQENRQYEEREDGQKDEKSFLAHHYDEAASAEC